MHVYSDHQHCAVKAYEVCEWVTFVDVDEFIFVTQADHRLGNVSVDVIILSERCIACMRGDLFSLHLSFTVCLICMQPWTQTRS
jgi:hypothetical protein